MKVGVCLPYMEPELDRRILLHWMRAIDDGPFHSLTCGERIHSVCRLDQDCAVSTHSERGAQGFLALLHADRHCDDFFDLARFAQTDRYVQLRWKGAPQGPPEERDPMAPPAARDPMAPPEPRAKRKRRKRRKRGGVSVSDSRSKPPRAPRRP